MCFEVAEGLAHLREKDLRALVGPFQGRCEETEHESFNPSVEAQLVPAALTRGQQIFRGCEACITH